MEMDENSKNSSIRLVWREATSIASANITLSPVWLSIEIAINRVYSSGGFVSIEIMQPMETYVKSIYMESLPGKYRIIVSTRDTNPKRKIWEWWESDNGPYRGKIRFRDDDWDARTVASKVAVAMDFFRDFYMNGDLTKNSFENLRTSWDPKP
jgi:hypothetical protein